MKSDDRSDKAHDRFWRLMPDLGTPEELQVLHGHLLIEALLREYAKEYVFRGRKHPSFKFTQLVWLVRTSLGSRCREDWIWGAADRLNDVRNIYAHELESTGIQKIREDFIQQVSTVRPGVETLEEIDDDIGDIRLWPAISILYDCMLEELDPRNALSVVVDAAFDKAAVE